MHMVYANAIDRAAEELEMCANVHAAVKKLIKRYAFFCFSACITFMSSFFFIR